MNPYIIFKENLDTVYKIVYDKNEPKVQEFYTVRI